MIRLATAEDFRSYTGRDPDARWCAQWYGFLAEDEGAVLGIAVVSRDEFGRVWVWSDVRGRLSAFLLHRLVRTHFAALRAAGVVELHAYCSDTVPGAEKWLRRLGFLPDPTLAPHKGRPVFKCTLST